MTESVETEDDLLRAVWHGAMSIDEGVSWGLEHGYPFTVLPTSELAAFRGAAWTVEQAIGWIAFRTNDGGARAGALLRYWGRGLLGAAAEPDQRESLSDAKDALWNGLIGGTVTATGIAGHRQAGSSPARVPIPASDFIDLEWTSKGLGRHVLQQDMTWIDVRLPAPDVRRLWPLEGDGSLSSKTGPKNKDRGGATPQYDEVEFLIEAFRILYEDGRSPASQADLNRRATDAYAAAKGLPAGKPSLEWGKENIRRLWVGLGLERSRRP